MAKMLVLLTTKCRMNCSHCMINASPDGADMNEETLKDSISFIKKVKPIYLVISGGEFTEHHDFFKFITRIIDESNVKNIFLLSNGMFITDEKKTRKVKDLLARDSVKMLQITNIRPYYPIVLKTDQFSSLGAKVYYGTQITDIVQLGRAKTNGIGPVSTRAPTCINLYLIQRQGIPSFEEIVRKYQATSNYGKCKPSIDPLGNVHVGESVECRILGTVNDPMQKLYDVLKNTRPCDKCKAMKNVKPEIVEMFFNKR
jgi:organic radical activating enzyme